MCSWTAAEALQAGALADAIAMSGAQAKSAAATDKPIKARLANYRGRSGRTPEATALAYDGQAELACAAFQARFPVGDVTKIMMEEMPAGLRA